VLAREDEKSNEVTDEEVRFVVWSVDFTSVVTDDL